MLEDVVVIGLTIVLVEVIKRLARRSLDEEAVKQIIVPLSVFALAGGLNVANAYIFTPELPWREALQQGLTLGAISGGIYSLGKAALGKS